jgi:hypothetical protein
VDGEDRSRELRFEIVSLDAPQNVVRGHKIRLLHGL